MTHGFALNVLANVLPFGNLNNQNFHSFIHNKSEMNESSVRKYTNDNSILTLNPPPSLKLLFNQFNELTAEPNKKNPENFITVEILIMMKSKRWKLNQSTFFIPYLKSSSLNKNFEDLEYLLKASNKTFDVIAISESRILKDTNWSKDINIRNYSVEFIPTESQAVGTLHYINNKLSYKLRQDRCIYKSSELESTFIERINPKKTKMNIIIGFIYRHPTMNLNELNDKYLTPI